MLVTAVVLMGLTASAPPHRVHAVGAVGVVVRHGDGRVVYAYIPLVSDRITGADALQGAGFPLNVQASSSLGAAVCKIDGEGCNAPKEDCFCKSYGNPAYYWHYYIRGADGTWRTASVGAGNRVLHDGDVDGWSWTADDPKLPAVSLAEIAALVQPAATAMPVSGGSAPETSPTPARVPPPVIAPSSASPIAAPPTDLPPTLVPAISRTALPATTPPLPAPTASPARSAPIPDAPRAVPDDATPRAVIVAPGGTVTPVQPAPPEDSRGRGAFGGFVAVAVVALLLLALVPLGARRGKGRGNGGNGRPR